MHAGDYQDKKKDLGRRLTDALKLVLLIGIYFLIVYLCVYMCIYIRMFVYLYFLLFQYGIASIISC